MAKLWANIKANKPACVIPRRGRASFFIRRFKNMKRMFTQLEIQALALLALSPTVSGLEDSITEKGFSGEVTVSTDESGKYIDAVDIPEASGVYKLNDDGDILGIIQIDLDAGAWLSIVNGKMYQGAIVENADLEFYGNNLAGTKPIYFHPVLIEQHSSESENFYLELIILNNDPTPYTKVSLVTYLKSKALATFITSGTYTSVGNYTMSPTGIYVTNINRLFLLGYDSNGARHGSTVNPINAETMISNAESVSDGVNKIN